MAIVDFHWVDVFTDRPFGGSPLTVFPAAGGLEEAQMQLLARELPNTETAFLMAPDDPNADIRLRIFSPRREMPPAGHAVVGASYVLAMLEQVALVEPVTQVRLEGLGGILSVEIQVQDGEIRRVVASAAEPAFGPPLADKGLVAAAFGIPEARIGPGELLPHVVDVGAPWLLVPVEDLRTVQRVRVEADLAGELARWAGTDLFYLFTLETEDPAATVHGRHVPAPGPMPREEPVSGAAAAGLGAFLVRQGVLLAAPGARLVVEQGHEMGRPGQVDVEVAVREGMVHQVRVGGPVVHMGLGRFEL